MAEAKVEAKAGAEAGSKAELEAEVELEMQAEVGARAGVAAVAEAATKTQVLQHSKLNAHASLTAQDSSASELQHAAPLVSPAAQSQLGTDSSLPVQNAVAAPLFGEAATASTARDEKTSGRARRRRATFHHLPPSLGGLSRASARWTIGSHGPRALLKLYLYLYF